MPDTLSVLQTIGKSALETVRSSITIADATTDDLPIVYVNPAFENLTEYDRHEVIGRNCRILQGPETDLAALRRVRQALNEKRSVRAILLNYRKSGSPFFNELFVGPIRNEMGQITHFVGCQKVVQSPELTALRIQAQDRIATLSRRERQVFDGLVRGASIKEIAREEELSPRTLEKYRIRMQKKMGTKSLALLVRYSCALGTEFDSW